MAEEQTNKRWIPQNELDYALMTTDSVWGKSEVPYELRNKLNKYFLGKDKDGKQEITKESMWGLLGFFTRDMRLGYLNEWNGELAYCQYMLNLANDLLQENMTSSFLVALSRVATILELSQSKKGFLRRNMNTFVQENIHKEQEPPKKSLFGIGKQQGSYNY